MDGGRTCPLSTILPVAGRPWPWPPATSHRPLSPASGYRPSAPVTANRTGKRESFVLALSLYELRNQSTNCIPDYVTLWLENQLAADRGHAVRSHKRHRLGEGVAVPSVAKSLSVVSVPFSFSYYNTYTTNTYKLHSIF